MKALLYDKACVVDPVAVPEPWVVIFNQSFVGTSYQSKVAQWMETLGIPCRVFVSGEAFFNTREDAMMCYMVFA